MPKHNDIDLTAARWVAREHAGALEQKQRHELAAWLEADLRHQGAYVRAKAAFCYFDRARALGPGYRTSAFLAPVGTGDRPNRRRRLILAGLATAAAVPVLGLGLDVLLLGADSYRTRRGEILRVPLSDGSIATLNSDTRIRVEYDQHRRRIVLLRGEALFDVAKNRHRPFLVQAGDATVTAVGTSFSVQRLQDRGLHVAVREGVVDFERQGASPLRLPANFAATADSGQATAVAPLAPAQIERLLAWREGMLSFEGDTLAQAVKAFSRYSDVRIVVDDPALLHSQVAGRYSATDPRGFARAVAAGMGLSVEEHDGDIHLLRRAGSRQHRHIE